jgi:branched-chain amino acid transport system ATP-binding protein
MTRMSTSEPLLAVENLTAGYGEGLVLHGISLSVAAGGSLAVLGRNGVGKTTLLLCLLGHVRPRGGAMRFRGADLTALQPHERAAAGLGWVPQGREMFPSLTVDEHLKIAARPGPWNRERVYAQFPRLAERRANYGNQLSGGEQQMLAIGRALMTNAEMLLMDEPLEGLAPVIVAEVAACIKHLIDEEGTTVLLVEQHAKFALELTREAIVLERGRIIHASPSAELLADEVRLDTMIGMRRLHDPAAAG